jgi:hypothetical protein
MQNAVFTERGLMVNAVFFQVVFTERCVLENSVLNALFMNAVFTERCSRETERER